MLYTSSSSEAKKTVNPHHNPLARNPPLRNCFLPVIAVGTRVHTSSFIISILHLAPLVHLCSTCCLVPYFSSGFNGRSPFTRFTKTSHNLPVLSSTGSPHVRKKFKSSCGVSSFAPFVVNPISFVHIYPYPHYSCLLSAKVSISVSFSILLSQFSLDFLFDISRSSSIRY